MLLSDDEMKFAVLYTMKAFEVPITADILTRILTWDKDVMGYFDVQSVLLTLKEDKFIEDNYYKNDAAYALTELGSQTNELFCKRLPKSVRVKIDEAVGNIKYDTLIKTQRGTGEIIPSESGEYFSALTVTDGEETVMELRLRIGDRDSARNVAKYMEDHADDIYNSVLKSVFPNE